MEAAVARNSRDVDCLDIQKASLELVGADSETFLKFSARGLQMNMVELLSR
jgi:hypothetical protein